MSTRFREREKEKPMEDVTLDELVRRVVEAIEYIKKHGKPPKKKASEVDWREFVDATIWDVDPVSPDEVWD